MGRALVSNQRLLQILNERLHAHDDCKECYFSSAVMALRCPDSEGCNWSRDLNVRCSARTSQACKLIAECVIDDLARQYNLEA